jgi:tetratricopeptide (TPR) repeat protein
MYLRGLAHAQMLQAPQAQADLEAAMDRSGHAELKAKAAAALGELAMSAGDAASAQQWYCKSLALEDRRSPADQAYFQLGLILQRQGQWQQADIQFSRLVFFFEGELARQARQRMQSRAWTVQAGCFDSRTRAQGLADRLNQANLAASVAPVLEQGKLAFSVQVGRYNTYEQAQAQLPAVARLAQGAQVVVTR